MERAWLIEKRKKQNKSQAEVAKQSEIVQQSYQLIEKGINTPRPDTAKKIAAALGFSWTRFYEDNQGAEE